MATNTVKESTPPPFRDGFTLPSDLYRCRQEQKNKGWKYHYGKYRTENTRCFLKLRIRKNQHPTKKDQKRRKEQSTTVHTAAQARTKRRWGLAHDGIAT